MPTACRPNSSTSGGGIFGSGPHPKPCFGCLHRETSFVRGYLKTWDLHDTQTLISLSFFALPCEHHNHSSHCSYDSDGSPLDLLPYTRSLISRVLSSLDYILCITMSSVHLLIRTEGNREFLHLSGSHVPMASSLAQVVCCPRNEKSNSEIITLFKVLDLRGA